MALQIIYDSLEFKDFNLGETNYSKTSSLFEIMQLIMKNKSKSCKAIMKTKSPFELISLPAQ